MRKTLRSLVSAAVMVFAIGFLSLATFTAATEFPAAHSDAAPVIVVQGLGGLPDGAKLIALGSALLGLAGAMRRWA